MQIRESIVHLIPKPSWGQRPVGLLPSRVRLWERARKEDMGAWRKAHAKDFDWMREGKGAERSIWAQTVYEEAAKGRGNETASVMLDLTKAFEQVLLQKVWEQGMLQNMPGQLLVMALESCAFGRRLTFKGAVSDVVNTLSAILAGSGFAVDLLTVVLSSGLDDLL